MDEELMSIDEASEASGLGRNSLYKAINSGELIARKYGRRTMILKSDFQDFLEALPKYEPKAKKES